MQAVVQNQASGCVTPALKAAKIIRVLTIPPVMAVALLVTLRLAVGAFPGATLWIIMGCLAVLPCLAYPICALIPALRRKGRAAERTVAVVFSVLGYVGACTCSFAAGLTGVDRTVCLIYLFSGLTIAIVQKLTGWHISGHACGLSGPVAVAAYYLHPAFALGYLLLLPVVISSLALKRHSGWELTVGAAVPVIVMLILDAVL
ncbi:MAG: hypothetical protein J6X61_01140 [Clostridia bacterium]|nr:hypothetical protein [Clostridia bacterium]